MTVASFFELPGFSMRFILLLACSLLLHWTAIAWIGSPGGIADPPPANPPAFQVDLRHAKLSPPGAMNTVGPSTPTPAPPASKRHRRRVNGLPVPTRYLSGALADHYITPPLLEIALADNLTTGIPIGMAVPGTSVEAATEISSPSPATAPISENPASKPVQTDSPKTIYLVALPPSAEIKYDVRALRGLQTVYGSSKIRWFSDGQDYSIHGETSVLFLTLLTFKSEGTIDNAGIQPELYTEKRLRKSETNTHFHRQRNTISFSASTTTYPRRGGEQDRASIIWQLAGIGRGDLGKQFTAGENFEIFVAGVRDGETWHIQVAGREQLAHAHGSVAAWHLIREPRPGSYEQKLDIWLAPEQDWYPVQLRFTEANGDLIDMTVSSISGTGSSLPPPP